MLKNAVLSEKESARIKLFQGSAFDLPFDDGKFDAVICTRFIHQYSNSLKLDLINEMERIVKPNGLLIIEFYDLYFHESKKHSKTEKKEEHFDLSYNHIANQFHKVHDKLVILAKDVLPGTNKKYIESRNLQSKINLRKISSLFGSKR